MKLMMIQRSKTREIRPLLFSSCSYISNLSYNYEWKNLQAAINKLRLPSGIFQAVLLKIIIWIQKI